MARPACRPSTSINLGRRLGRVVAVVVVVVVVVHGPFLDGFATHFIAPLGASFSLSIPVSFRPLLSFFSLSRLLFVSPSLGFSLSGLTCAVSLHPTLTYPSTCLPRRCTPSLPSANPTRTITYTRTIFPIPTYRAPSLPSARVFFIYSAIPRSNATLRTR